MKIVFDPWNRPWVFSGWIHPASGRAYKELGELVSLLRRAKMSGDDQYNQAAGASPYYDERLTKVAHEGMHLGSLRTPKVRSVINDRITQLKAQLAAHEELIKQLDANPSTESLLDAMRKLGI